MAQAYEFWFMRCAPETFGDQQDGGNKKGVSDEEAAVEFGPFRSLGW